MSIPVMQHIAGLVVLLTAAWLIGFAAWTVWRLEQARRFLESFASSARAHYTEQLTRLLVGAALLLKAPTMLYPQLFTVFGWVLLGTTAVLLVTPWRMHQRFAQWAVPLALRYHLLYAFASFLLGLALACALLAPAF